MLAILIQIQKLLQQAYCEKRKQKLTLVKREVIMTRTYVITGSASGIGAATAKLLKDAGNTVIGVDLKNADVEADLSTHLVATKVRQK